MLGLLPPQILELYISISMYIICTLAKEYIVAFNNWRYAKIDTRFIHLTYVLYITDKGYIAFIFSLWETFILTQLNKRRKSQIKNLKIGFITKIMFMKPVELYRHILDTSLDMPPCKNDVTMSPTRH